MKPVLRHLALVGCLVCVPTLAPVAQAADTPEPAPAPAAKADPLAEARQFIKARQWSPALNSLQRVNATRSADWNNLMGYVLRKSSPADLVGAERHYNEALRIQPDHRGALEYVGELHLMQADLPKAEARLAALAKACAARCEEHADLLAEIERFKRNGNRWVAKP
ncbi:MAG: tetratricopeptide repeat protein [Rubrivivax sp.]|jgi:Flp pilus assembly protein TadD